MPSSVEIPAAKRLVLAVQPNIYDASTGGYRSGTLYFTSPKERADSWVSATLAAQRSGMQLPSSAEWYQGRENIREGYGEAAETDFIKGHPEFTRTVFDYDHEELLEGIRFRDAPEDEITENPYEFIESVEVRLGANDGVFLPQQNDIFEDLPRRYVKSIRDLPERYVKLAAHLWGVKNPKKNLPPNAYLLAGVGGFQPIIRGNWHRYGNRRVNVNAGGRSAGGWGFAARFVSRTMPENLTNLITLEAYRKLERKVAADEATLRALLEEHRTELDAAIVLMK